MNAVAELGDPKHAANNVVFAHKEERRIWFRELLMRLGVRDPNGLAACGQARLPRPPYDTPALGQSQPRAQLLQATTRRHAHAAFRKSPICASRARLKAGRLVHRWT